MTRAALLRRLFLRIHPDKFHSRPSARQTNEESFAALQQLLGADAALTERSQTLTFYIGDSDVPIQAQLSSGRALDGSLRALLARVCGDEPAAADTAASAASKSAEAKGGQQPSRFTARPWWLSRRQAPAPAPEMGTVRQLLVRHAAESARLGEEAAAAAEALRLSAARVSASTGIEVAFDASLRCDVTKQRLLHSLATNIDVVELRGALHGGGAVRFTSGGNSCSGLTADAAGDARACADTGNTNVLWLSSQDTPADWLDAARTHRRLRGAAAVNPGGRPAAAALVAAAEAEAAAAAALHVHAVRAESVAVRRDPEYTAYVRALAAAPLAAGGAWAALAPAAAGWSAVVTPRAALRPLRQPSLRAESLRLRLPLGVPPQALASLLEGEGAAAAAAVARARRALRRCRTRLVLRSLRVAEGKIAPEQVEAACEAALAQAATLAPLSAGTCWLISPSGSGLGMLLDGTLRVPHDALR